MEKQAPSQQFRHLFLPTSHLFGDVMLAHDEAQAMNMSTMELIQARGGMIRHLHMPPEEAERTTKTSKVFYTLEDYIAEIEK